MDVEKNKITWTLEFSSTQFNKSETNIKHIARWNEDECWKKIAITF